MLCVAAALMFAAAAQAPDVQSYESVLQQHVRDDGRVDYAALRSSDALRRFVAQLSEVSPESHPALFPTMADRLAYWINAHNALVLHAFAREYPEKRTQLESLWGKYQFFFRAKHMVGGRERTLDDIAKNSIRNEGDPRVHFALVCAARGCPPPARFAFTAAALEPQLELVTRRFMGDDRQFRFVVGGRPAVTLPRLFDWYAEDFGGTRGVLDFVAKYRPTELSRMDQGRVKIEYFDYDWSPNDLR